MPNKKVKYVVIEPISEKGKKELAYHTTKWEFREEIEKLKFSRDPGPFLVLRSLDGSKVLFVKKEGDLHFRWRTV